MSRSIVDQGEGGTRWADAKAPEGLACPIFGECDLDRLVAGDGGLRGGVGGLDPLIARVAVFQEGRVAQLEMERSTVQAKLFQPFQDGEELGFPLSWILEQGVFSTQEQATGSVVGEDFDPCDA